MAEQRETRNTAWRAFDAWERRLRASALSPAASPDDLLFRCAAGWADSLDDGSEGCPEADLSEKVAFMRAYLSLMSLDAPNWEGDAIRLLGCQERARAPQVYGCWFRQSNMALFGAGGSDIFQSTEIGLFCEALDDIDFADVASLQPFDGLQIRKPDGDWTSKECKAIARRLRADLRHEGGAIKLKSWTEGRYLNFNVYNPDYGLM